ncbi:MAG: excinuclease ABC subunit UvrC [Actinomycetota bacterium]
MSEPVSYRPLPGEIPTGPGVYRFLDRHGRVLYVGKAKNLRARLSSYFQDPALLHPRTSSMVTSSSAVDWTLVSTEVEALQLEYSWIKEYEPRFNVKYRDDKSYPYLAVTMGEEFPRVQVLRGAKRPATRYFGPYSHAWAIRDTVDLLLRVFPVRTCSAGVFRRAHHSGRPCLLGYIDKCSAPCVERISSAAHRQLAEDFCEFMAGDTAKFIASLEGMMRDRAAALDFEQAGRIRDDITALRRALERNAVVLGDDTDADIFALAGDDLEAAIHVFFVRGGRVRGQRGWVVEKVEDITEPELIEHLLQQVYGAAPESVPREILIPQLPQNPLEVAAWLSGLRGSRVTLRVPHRGDKHALLETVKHNATQALTLHKTRRAGDLTTRSQALQELQEALGLEEAPLRIECYDISHIQGSDVVGSMVVFEDGLARKSEYKRFVVRGTEGHDDLAWMAEVLQRRFRRLLSVRNSVGRHDESLLAEFHSEQEASVSSSIPNRSFAYPPQLVVVDGGPTQAKAASDVLALLGVLDVSVIGLAKRLEEVWVPGEEYPVILPRGSASLYLLQRVRDEAHRFAVTFHRKRRSRSMTASALDGIPGIGPRRQAALLAEFGSVKRLREASLAEIAAVPGISRATAALVMQAVKSSSVAVGVNVTTGELHSSS